MSAHAHGAPAARPNRSVTNRPGTPYRGAPTGAPGLPAAVVGVTVPFPAPEVPSTFAPLQTRALQHPRATTSEGDPAADLLDSAFGRLLRLCSRHFQAVSICVALCVALLPPLDPSRTVSADASSSSSSSTSNAVLGAGPAAHAYELGLGLVAASFLLQGFLVSWHISAARGTVEGGGGGAPEDGDETGEEKGQEDETAHDSAEERTQQKPGPLLREPMGFRSPWEREDLAAVLDDVLTPPRECPPALPSTSTSTSTSTSEQVPATAVAATLRQALAAANAHAPRLMLSPHSAAEKALFGARSKSLEVVEAFPVAPHPPSFPPPTFRPALAVTSAPGLAQLRHDAPPAVPKRRLVYIPSYYHPETGILIPAGWVDADTLRGTLRAEGGGLGYCSGVYFFDNVL
jgi:hypothetical protein